MTAALTLDATIPLSTMAKMQHSNLMRDSESIPLKLESGGRVPLFVCRMPCAPQQHCSRAWQAHWVLQPQAHARSLEGCSPEQAACASPGSSCRLSKRLKPCTPCQKKPLFSLTWAEDTGAEGHSKLPTNSERTRQTAVLRLDPNMQADTAQPIAFILL